MNFVKSRLFAILAVVGIVFSLFLGPEALAGTGGTEFADIYTLMTGSAKGTLGKVIALAMFMVGITAGVVNQSIVAAVVGIAGALVMYYGPAVIDGIVSAVI